MVSVRTRTAYDMAIATQYNTQCVCSPRRLCLGADVLMLVTSSGVLVCSVLGANGVISLSEATSHVNGTTTHTNIEHAFDETTICITVAIMETINIVFGTVLLIIVSKAEASARWLWAWLLAWGSAQAQALALGLALAAHALWERAGLAGGLLLAHVAHRFVLAALLIAATNALRSRVSEPQQLINRQMTLSKPPAPNPGKESGLQLPSKKSRPQRFDSRKSAFSMWNEDTGFGEARQASLRRAVPNSHAHRMEIVPLWEVRQHVGQCACCTGIKDVL